MSQLNDFIDLEWFNHFINASVKAVVYEDGFGINGCDLSLNHWWVAYTGNQRRIHPLSFI